MLNYIIRRFLYSFFIIIGVMIITFLLFRVAAGDPAESVLGKNPSAEQIESKRIELGSNLPLFWGYKTETEIYRSRVFSEDNEIPDIEITGDYNFRNETLEFKKGKIVFLKRFSSKTNDSFLIEFTMKGQCQTQIQNNQKFIVNKDIDKFEINLNRPLPQKLEFKFTNALLKSVKFYKLQNTPWNSQFLESMNEIVSFKKAFPYFSFYNFGLSLTTREPVKNVIISGILPSLMLMIPIFVGELIIGVILAMISAAFRDTLIDRAVVVFSVAGMSVSYLVFIIFGQWYLGYYYNLFPVWGWGDFKHLFLPVIVGILSGLGGGVRFYRTIFINEINKEYLRTAKSKGCGTYKLYFSHLFRNALVPILSRLSSTLPFLFTGSLLLETFFGIPGLGYAGINALNNADLQLLKALVITGALLFVTVNLITDIAYAWVDPRIRLK